MKRNRNRRVNFIFNERKNSRMFLLCNFANRIRNVGHSTGGAFQLDN